MLRLTRIAANLPVLALLVTAASVAIQGFAYGVSNNAFHIPLVLHDFALPQFADDAFQQTLPRFASPLFPALSLVATRNTLPAWFFALHVVGRFLTVWAMLRLLQSCGVAGPRLLFAAAVLVAMPGLYGRTALGQQDLWPDYFTHTSLAQAALLWAVVRLAEGRFVAACVLSAVAFDVNAFVGVWMAGPLLAHLLAHRLGPVPRIPWRTAATGTAVGLAVALPVALWVASVATVGRPGFDYPAFLRSYYPFHFFIDAAPNRAVVQLAAAVGAGGLAFTTLRVRPGLLAGAGLLAVFATGIVVGAAASSPLLLNLHLLRVDGPLVLLATCGTVALAVRSAGRDAFATGCATAAIAGCLAANWVIALLGLLALRLPAPVRDRVAAPLRPAWTWCLRHPAPVLALGAGLLAVNGAALAAYKHWPAPRGAVADQYYAGQWPAVPFWRDAKLWAQGNTAPNAVFLVPLKLEGFEADSLRQAWVDWKSGAAAMWAPSFHGIWVQRMEEVAALHTPAERIRYACAHALDYAILDIRGAKDTPGTVAGVQPAYHNPAFAIYPTRSCPPGP